jgi:hypothetical protein
MEHDSWSIAALQDVNGLADSIARSEVLNLPLLFAVALALTIFGPAAPSRTFMRLRYIFDLMSSRYVRGATNVVDDSSRDRHAGDMLR